MPVVRMMAVLRTAHSLVVQHDCDPISNFTLTAPAHDQTVANAMYAAHGSVFLAWVDNHILSSLYRFGKTIFEIL